MPRRNRPIVWETCERRELLSTVPAMPIDPATVVNLVITPTGQPSARQAQRQEFRAAFSGPFTMGKGRFSTEANQIYIRGLGGSNQFLHGDVQLRIVTPTDSTIPAAGSLAAFDKNINSNSVLGLSVQADPTSNDRAGRPTRLTIYALDANVSAGLYVEGQASGTIDVRYYPRKGTSPGLTSSGTATIKINAVIYSTHHAFLLTNAKFYNGSHKR